MRYEDYFNRIPEMETERFKLTAFSRDRMEEYFDILRDDEVQKYLGGAVPLFDREPHITNWLRNINGRLLKRKLVFTWCVIEKDTVFITITFSSVWVYWGAIENFHEGWYSTSIWENLFMLFFQYLLITIIFVSLAVTILRWKKIGLILHFIIAIVSVWFFSGASFNIIGLMIAIPIIALGLAYYYGEPKPRK